nr:MAG TPA: hypothetical protein [Caudoviricetes sp.]
MGIGCAGILFFDVVVFTILRGRYVDLFAK